MIYSKWRPVDGKYDYFKSNDQVGLGDDMPLPPAPITRSPIGVASVSIGRRPKGFSRHVGTGEMALGSVMPTTSMSIGSIDKSTVMTGLALLAGLVIGYGIKPHGNR
jgi:hypothetical protein